MSSCMIVSKDESFAKDVLQTLQGIGYEDGTPFLDPHMFARYVNSHERGMERIAVVVDARLGQLGRDLIGLVSATHDRWCAVSSSPEDAGEGGWRGVLQRHLTEAWQVRDAAAAEQAIG